MEEGTNNTQEPVGNPAEQALSAEELRALMQQEQERLTRESEERQEAIRSDYNARVEEFKRQNKEIAGKHRPADTIACVAGALIGGLAGYLNHAEGIMLAVYIVVFCFAGFALSLAATSRKGAKGSGGSAGATIPRPSSDAVQKQLYEERKALQLRLDDVEDRYEDLISRARD